MQETQGGPQVKVCAILLLEVSLILEAAPADGSTSFAGFFVLIFLFWFVGFGFILFFFVSICGLCLSPAFSWIEWGSQV